MSLIRAALVLSLLACPISSYAASLIRSSAPVRDEYIVRLADDAEARLNARVMAREHGVTVLHVYSGVIRGFAFRGNEQAAAAIARNPHVLSVSETTMGRVAGTQSPVPSVGLDRIDQRYGYLDNSYTYDVTGEGVIIYIVDSGVHEVADLAGRIIRHRDFVDGNLPAEDEAMHGTSVASIAAGTVYGVAKNASIVDLRVANRYGQVSSSALIGALDDIWTSHPAGVAGVVNLSMSIPGEDSNLDLAIQRLTYRGIPVVGSAGDGYHLNSSDTPCSYPSLRFAGHAPARLGIYSGVITVSSVHNDSFISETRPDGDYYTGYGPCIDIFAPTRVAAMNGNGFESIFTGTSASAPFVSGVAALVQQRSPSLIGNAAAIEHAITTNATRDVLYSVPPDTVNLLLYSRPE